MSNYNNLGNGIASGKTIALFAIAFALIIGFIIAKAYLKF